MTTYGNCHNPGLHVDAKGLCVCKVNPSKGSLNLKHELSPRGQAEKKLMWYHHCQGCRP